jgi:hypothetical protein
MQSNTRALILTLLEHTNILNIKTIWDVKPYKFVDKDDVSEEPISPFYTEDEGSISLPIACTHLQKHMASNPQNTTLFIFAAVRRKCFVKIF